MGRNAKLPKRWLKPSPWASKVGKLQSRPTFLSREEVIAHLDYPVCEILSGVRIHLHVIGLKKMWELCYALGCDTPRELAAVMWDMIKKRKQKDSTWQDGLPTIAKIEHKEVTDGKTTGRD